MNSTLINHMGTDLTVVNAARVSFNKESDWEHVTPAGRLVGVLTEKDEKLINYLGKHNHFTPFTHCTITMREDVPIFIARQRFKHTIGFSYNEISRRYVDSLPEFYTPKEWRKRAENAKQGSSDEVVDIDYEFSYESKRGWYYLKLCIPVTMSLVLYMRGREPIIYGVIHMPNKKYKSLLRDGIGYYEVYILYHGKP